MYNEGYLVASAVARDNLKLGLSVVADSTNPVSESRELWQKTAVSADSKYVEIEVICSNKTEHQKRIKSRNSDIPGLKLPSWQDVLEREYDQWNTNRIVIDTSGKTLEESQSELISLIETTI